MSVGRLSCYRVLTPILLYTEPDGTGARDYVVGFLLGFYVACAIMSSNNDFVVFQSTADRVGQLGVANARGGGELLAARK